MTKESFHIDFIIKIWPRLLQALPITVLMALGANAAELQDKATLLETANQLNVSFPNLKLK